MIVACRKRKTIVKSVNRNAVNRERHIKMKQKFREWFNITWTQEEGLVNEATAAKIIGITAAMVRHLRTKKKRIRSFVFEDDKAIYLSRKDVERLAELYEFKRKFDI